LRAHFHLYHFLVIEAVQGHFGYRSLATDLAAAALSILAGAISWEVLEEPVGSLKRWFPYRDSDSGTEIPGSRPRVQDSGSPVPDPECRTPGSVCCSRELPA
jgi:peptidoglycan/LPS O-acetylase OafA/YrhL